MRIVQGEPPAETLKELDFEGVEKIVVLLVDGLGMSQLERAFEEGIVPNLQEAKEVGGLKRISTTLPSTTATALVSLSTTSYPWEHGFLGFRLFLQEVGVLANMIRLTVLNGDTSLEDLGLREEALLARSTILQRCRSGDFFPHAVTREEFLGSAFTRLLYRGADPVGYHSSADMMVQLGRICRKGKRALVLAYWDTVDVLCHRHGSTSPEALAALSSLDHLLGRELLHTGLQDVFFLVTADHGHIDCPADRTVDLAGHVELMPHLSLPPTGDARLPYLHVRDGHKGEVVDYLDDHFGDIAGWMESTEALKAGLFGPGADGTWLARLGDLILLPKYGYCFTYTLQEERVPFLSRHGGASPQEMFVPLLWCRL